MNRKASVFALIATVLPATGHADNLAGSDRFLCASTQVVRCYADGDCDSGPAWELNMPSFIHVDVRKKLLSTPAASAEQRRSPVEEVLREDGQIIIQGNENGRALSMVINEETGLMASAIALDGITVNVFGACTPEPQG